MYKMWILQARTDMSIRGGHNVLFSKFEYVPGWMPLNNQFQDLFTKKIKF